VEQSYLVVPSGHSIVRLIPENEKPVAPEYPLICLLAFLLFAVDFLFGPNIASAFPRAPCLMFLAFSYLFLYVGQFNH